MHLLAGLLRQMGELDEAERLGAEAVERGRPVFLDRRPGVELLLLGHAQTLAALERFDRAEAEL